MPGTTHPLFNAHPCTLEHTTKGPWCPSCLPVPGTWGLGRKEAALWEQASKDTERSSSVNLPVNPNLFAPHVSEIFFAEVKTEYRSILLFLHDLSCFTYLLSAIMVISFEKEWLCKSSHFSINLYFYL